MVQNNEDVKQEILKIAVQELPNTDTSLYLSLSRTSITVYIPVCIFKQYHIYDRGILWLVICMHFRFQSSHYVSNFQN